MKTKEEKKQWCINKQAELEQTLKEFITNSAIDKSKIKDLTDHYKILGLYEYSFLNSMLIMSQGATIAQSFKKWKELNRSVKKGEKASVYIFRPFTYKKEVKNPETEESKTDERVRTFFRLVPIFDVNQTEGEPLEYAHNTTNIDIDYRIFKHKLQKICKVPIVEEITGEARGYLSDSKIGISSMSNDMDKLKTLIHEIAHHLMDHREAAQGLTRNTKEVEAETITHFVLSYLDLDYQLSNEYVASWKTEDTHKNVNYRKVMQSIDKIIKAIKE